MKMPNKLPIKNIIIMFGAALLGVLILINFSSLSAPVTNEAAIFLADTSALESPIIDTVPQTKMPPSTVVTTKWISISGKDLLDTQEIVGVSTFSPQSLTINKVNIPFYRLEYSQNEYGESWNFFNDKKEILAYITYTNTDNAWTVCHYDKEKTIFMSNLEIEVDNFHNYMARYK